MIKVKFCGLRTAADVQAAAQAGASYVGVVFFTKSPRHLSVEQARVLAEGTPDQIIKVALSVDATDAFLDRLTAAVPLDMLQLHGREHHYPLYSNGYATRFVLTWMQPLHLTLASVAEHHIFRAGATPYLV